MFRKLQFVLLFQFIALLTFSQESQKGKNVVVHTVEPGQTVYSISKQYLLKPEDLKEMNPSIDSTFAIKPGQILRIEIPDDLTNDEALKGLEKSPITHIVKDEETLYSISKTYNLPIATIQEWNSLTDNTIKLNQPLVVGWKYQSKPGHLAAEIAKDAKIEKQEQAKKTAENAVEKAPEQRRAAVSNDSYFSNNKQTVLRERYAADISRSTKASQTGFSIWFSTDNQLMSSNYYGLFSDVSVGSVVKVTNLMNNRSVYVKVIGGLPNTAENHGAMIKLTTAAQSVLQSTDGKVRVRVDYGK